MVLSDSASPEFTTLNQTSTRSNSSTFHDTFPAPPNLLTHSLTWITCHVKVSLQKIHAGSHITMHFRHFDMLSASIGVLVQAARSVAMHLLLRLIVNSSPMSNQVRIVSWSNHRSGPRTPRKYVAQFVREVLKIINPATQGIRRYGCVKWHENLGRNLSCHAAANLNVDDQCLC